MVRELEFVYGSLSKEKVCPTFSFLVGVNF